MQENLDLAKYAITTKKSNNENAGCYGVSAVILLSSILDSIGTFYCLDITATNTSVRPSNSNYEFQLYEKRFICNWEHYVGSTKSHFEQVYDNFITSLSTNYGISDRDTFVDIFYKLFRCELVHNGTTNIGISISNEEEKNVILRTNLNTYILHLKPLFDMVEEIYIAFVQQHGETIEKDVENHGFEVLEINTGITFENATQQASDEDN